MHAINVINGGCFATFSEHVFAFESQLPEARVVRPFPCVFGCMCLTGCPSSLVLVSLSTQEANQFLSRHRRANQVFEETRQGHLERECVEEKCSKEEAREVFENDPETVSVFGTKPPLKLWSSVQVDCTTTPHLPALVELLQDLTPAKSGN